MLISSSKKPQLGEVAFPLKHQGQHQLANATNAVDERAIVSN
jgi:hypothetical protein